MKNKTSFWLSNNFGILGRFLAEVTKEVLSDLEASKYQVQAIIYLSIFVSCLTDILFWLSQIICEYSKSVRNLRYLTYAQSSSNLLLRIY